MENILVVDDDKLVRTALSDMIKDLGYEVKTSVDGPQAILEAKQGYAMIFMDIGLPGVNGIEATSMIRRNEEPGGRRTPIVVLTSHQPSEVQGQCLAAGADEVITKPIGGHDLKKLLERHLQKTPLMPHIV